MPYVVRFESPGIVCLAEYEDGPVADTEVLIETLYSGISAGTELTAAYQGTNPYTNKRWDEARRLFVEGEHSIEYPIDGWGYEEVGRIAAVGTRVNEVRTGQVVYGTWGHRGTNRAPEEWAADRNLPEGLDPIVGVFSRIGAIALNAILDADLHLGETVAVFGQGVPGLIVGQLARLSGATVVAVDAIPRRLELARRLGAHHVVNVSEADAAAEVKEITDGRGGRRRDRDQRLLPGPARGDPVRGVQLAGRLGRVLPGRGHRALPRRGVPPQPSADRRLADLRAEPEPRSPLTVERMERTVMDLAARGDLDLAALVSHVFPVQDCADAFRLLAERPEEAVQVVLAFAGEIPEGLG